MKTSRIIGLLVLIIGILILVYGGFSYTKKTHEAKIGAVELSVNQKQTVYIPFWIGIIAVVSGGALLLVKQRSTR